jgi:hypothetical protein
MASSLHNTLFDSGPAAAAVRIMRAFVRAIDRYLRKRFDIFEYSTEDTCIFRIRIGHIERDLALPDETVAAGEPVLELHFWNEHLPPVPEGGHNMRWAVGLRRVLIASCRMLAARLEEDPKMADSRAVGGITPLFAAGDGSGWEKIFTRLGFIMQPHRNPSGRFVEFWERVYAWMVMRTFTVGSGASPKLASIHRTNFWISRDDFLRRYGNASAGAKTP